MPSSRLYTWGTSFTSGVPSPVKLSFLSVDGIGVSAMGALLSESGGNILTSAEIVVPSPLMEIVP